MALRVDWSDEARAEVRRLDRLTAMRVFRGLLRFAGTGIGDVKELQGDLNGRCRLRVGDYRLFFSQSGEVLRIHSVKHRSEAYR
jgi:mRNA-degrading endonuclease RelE of RelBE toxin-antitoxin system